MSTCAACKIAFNASCYIVPCTVCSNLFHETLDCAGLSASEIKVLDLKKKQMIVYKCFGYHSNDRGNNFVDAHSLSADLKDIKESCGILSSVQVELADVKAHIDGIVKSLDELPRLQSQLENLQSRILVLESSDPLSQNGTEKMFSELQDRISRSNNIILFNLKEISSGNSYSCDDLNLVKSILQPIGIDLGDIKVKRIGRLNINNNINKTRPIIVTLNNSRDVFTVFRNRFKLKHPIRVAFDKTKSQQEQYTKALSELRERDRPLVKLIL